MGQVRGNIHDGSIFTELALPHLERNSRPFQLRLCRLVTFRTYDYVCSFLHTVAQVVILTASKCKWPLATWGCLVLVHSQLSGRLCFLTVTAQYLTMH